MGMFDYITASVPCPYCGTEIMEWQTKSLDSRMRTYTLHAAVRRRGVLDALAGPREECVMSIHAECPRCKAWADLDLDPDLRLVPNERSRPRAG